MILKLNLKFYELFLKEAVYFQPLNPTGTYLVDVGKMKV